MREFLVQFDLIAYSNKWSDSAKTVTLASILRGKARAILDGIAEIESVTFLKLKAKLKLVTARGIRLCYIISSLQTRNRKMAKS